MLPLLPPLPPVPVPLLPPLPPLPLLPPEEDPPEDEPPELLLASFPASELPCPDPPLPLLHALARTRRRDEDRPSRHVVWLMTLDWTTLPMRLQDEREGARVSPRGHGRARGGRHGRNSPLRAARWI